MITVELASELIQKHLPDWGECYTTIEDLSFSRTVDQIYSDRSYPPFARLMMDGIATTWKAYQEGYRQFQILGVAPAGKPIQVLSDPTGCFEVMTGATLPTGADLVIPYEHLKIENNIAKVVLEAERFQFEHVHAEGSDCKKGEIALNAGEKLNGPHWGIAASMGYHHLLVKKSPKVLIVSTGDELIEVHKTPLPHQIRRSNAYALRSSLLVNGYSDVTLDHLPDDPIAVADHYQQKSSQFNILIYSGGVSKGKFDYLPIVWTEMGVTKHFHEVSQRPGKPLWFGVDQKTKTAVIGLPGNPVSSLVCLHRYLIQGRRIFAKLTDEFVFKKDLTYFLPVKVRFEPDGSISAIPLKIKNSGEFTALASSDGFIELPKEQSVFSAGQVFQFFPWKTF